jgi:hypothetical protein
MKILRPGTLPRNRLYRVICPNCDCLFEFFGREAMPRLSCPQGGCGHPISYTEENRIPEVDSLPKGGMLPSGQTYIVGEKVSEQMMPASLCVGPRTTA